MKLPETETFKINENWFCSKVVRKSMVYFSEDEIIRIFEDLPQHRGCSPVEIEEAESIFNGALPPFYKRLMLLDEQRMVATGSIRPVSELQNVRRDAEDILREEEELIEDWPVFNLSRNHVVFAWNDIYCFYYFEANGRDDVPVFRYVYYSDDDDRRPTIECRSVSDFMIESIRQFLKL